MRLASMRLASMPANALARRRARPYQTFSSPEQPPEPSLLFVADSRYLAHDRREITSQFWHVLESRNSEIDRLGHALAEIGNHHVRLCAKALDDRRSGKAPGAIGAVEQGEHPVLAGNVGHGRAESMGV